MKTGFSCQQSIPQPQKSLSFLVQALVQAALHYTASQNVIRSASQFKFWTVLIEAHKHVATQN